MTNPAISLVENNVNPKIRQIFQSYWVKITSFKNTTNPAISFENNANPKIRQILQSYWLKITSTLKYQESYNVIG